MNKIAKAVLLLFVATPLLAYTEPPTKADSYDGFAPGGRAIAMGMAFSAVSGDPANIYFNPAGLVDIKSNMLAVTYEVTRQSELTTEEIFSSEILKNRNFIFAGLIGSKGALSWRPLANDTVKTINDADWAETITKINAFTFSAAHEYSPTLSGGMNLSYLDGQIAESGINSGLPYIKMSDGYGFTLDWGMLYTPSQVFKIGIDFKNIAGTMWWDNYEKEQLPFILRAGFSYNISQFLIFATDWEKRYYRKAEAQDSMYFGIEQSLGKYLQIRGGVNGHDLNNQETTHISAGLGYQNEGTCLSLTGEKYRLNVKDVYRYIISLNLAM